MHSETKLGYKKSIRFRKQVWITGVNLDELVGDPTAIPSLASQKWGLDPRDLIDFTLRSGAKHLDLHLNAQIERRTRTDG